MAHTSITIATVYSSAQCILSVVGSVGVILLFAGIPQLIYSPVVSAANLLTFVMGAVLIMTMVAGNTFLNYKFRRMAQDSDSQGSGQDAGGRGSSRWARDSEDKPPSYDTILTLEPPPPEYDSIMPQKPPKYEEVIGHTYLADPPPDNDDDNDPTPTCRASTHALGEGSSVPRNLKKVITLNKVEEAQEDETSISEQIDKCEEITKRDEREEREQDSDEQQPSHSLSIRSQYGAGRVVAAQNTESQFFDESET